MPQHIPGLLWRKHTGRTLTPVSVLVDCVPLGYGQSHGCW